MKKQFRETLEKVKRNHEECLEFYTVRFKINVIIFCCKKVSKSFNWLTDRVSFSIKFFTYRFTFLSYEHFAYLSIL